MKPIVCSTALLASWLLVPSSAFALNQPTHDIVNRVAAQQSSLDTTLRNNLNLPDGLNQRLRGKPAVDWIGEGGIREDDGIRFFRHFHDPLKPWAQAGLGPASSSILWMQRSTDQTNCQEWTWSSARCYFYRALSAPTPEDREQAWADLFRAIGQLMHLVVDASVPEHTRRDPHPLGGLFGSYEYWAEQLHGRRGSASESEFSAKYLESPIRPEATLVEEPTSDAAAPVPVARLIDTKAYKGADPNLTLTSAIGIAEFSNANFFSEDSGYRRYLAPNYPYPSVERLVPSLRELPAGRGVRAYYKKGVGDGLEVDPVLAECAMDAAFRADGIPTPQYKCADESVWEQTALSMLPRAVGYAAGLVDYFFRGVFGATYEDQSLMIAGSDEVMVGDFQLLYDSTDGTRRALTSWALRVDPNEVSPPLSTPQLPENAAPGAPCWLIFRGQLGLESGAVAGAQVGCPPVPPPAPPPTGSWATYRCVWRLYGSREEVHYVYATPEPPLADDGLPIPTFYYVPPTGSSTCSLLNFGLAAQPPTTTTDHPA